MARGAICTRRTGYSLMIQRNGMYYFRKVVPEPLRLIIGKREVLTSLKTKDREEAKRKLHQVAAETDRLLDAAWRKHALISATPELIAERWKEQLLREDEQERSLLRSKTKEEFDQEVADLEGALTEGTSYLTFGNISGLQDSFLSVLEQHGVKLSPESPEFRKFAHVFLRVSVDVIQILRKRAIGDWSDTPSRAIPVIPMPTLAELENNPPLSVVLEKWRAERKPPSQTWHEWSTVFRRFREVAGEDLPVQAITKGHVRTFKDALMRAPRRTPERLRGRPFPEVIDATKDDKTPRLSVQSIHKQLSAVQGVLSWAVKQGYREDNPAIGLKPEERKGGEDKRLPYDTADLQRIFASPMYRGCFSASSRSKPGDKVIRDVSYWLPVLGLFTGARLQELGQLLRADVKDEDGITYLDIRAGDGKSLKTGSSKRRVPIHPELVRVGFLDFVKAQRERVTASGPGLFPELRADVHGKLTGRWAKWYGRYSNAIGITDHRKVFHSFRHTFKDACRRAGIAEEVHDALTGHSNGSVGRSYGLGVPLKVLAEAVEKVSYAGLDLSQLRYPVWRQEAR